MSSQGPAGAGVWGWMPPPCWGWDEGVGATSLLGLGTTSPLGLGVWGWVPPPCWGLGYILGCFFHAGVIGKGQLHGCGVQGWQSKLGHGGRGSGHPDPMRGLGLGVGMGALASCRVPSPRPGADSALTCQGASKEAACEEWFSGAQGTQ